MVIRICQLRGDGQLLDTSTVRRPTNPEVNVHVPSAADLISYGHLNRPFSARNNEGVYFPTDLVVCM